jgi:hypothetical protein
MIKCSAKHSEGWRKIINWISTTGSLKKGSEKRRGGLGDSQYYLELVN